MSFAIIRKYPLSMFHTAYSMADTDIGPRRWYRTVERLSTVRTARGVSEATTHIEDVEVIMM